MALTIAVPKETNKGELRVAATPETTKKLADLGAKIKVETNAGVGASLPDSAFKDAGALICKSAEEVVKGADIILRVQISDAKDLESYPEKTLLISQVNPYQNDAVLQTAAEKKIDLFAMELIPRITRAQAMDVLSSQANLAGYKAVLDACEYFGKAFPMMMTAAGTIPPARVFVMGAGVAGLQAIATARRLGAQVTATDVRPAAKEQVESLGANFVAVEDEEFKQAESAGGYAKEMSKDYQKKQEELISEHIRKQDIVITTALIPGKAAPKLVSQDHVKSMKPGSVIVDLAAPNGGNCELTQKGKVLVKHDVTIIGHENVASRLASDTSALYARNLLNLLKLFIEEGELKINWDDEIIKGIALTKSGEIIHPNFTKTKAKDTKKSSESPKKSPQGTSTTTKKPTKSSARKPAKKAAAPKESKDA